MQSQKIPFLQSHGQYARTKTRAIHSIAIFSNTKTMGVFYYAEKVFSSAKLNTMICQLYYLPCFWGILKNIHKWGNWLKIINARIWNIWIPNWSLSPNHMDSISIFWNMGAWSLLAISRICSLQPISIISHLFYTWCPGMKFKNAGD